MSFLRKLFGLKKTSSDTPASSSPPPDELIQAYDSYGRGVQMPRQQWLTDMILPNLKKSWHDPEALASLILSGFNDGFFKELEDAAKQLSTIDPTPSRGATLLSITYLQADQPAKAERVLQQHIKAHGEEGVILTNLAKAQDALGRSEEALATLWHALELDPNQDNGLGWYAGIHREKEGPTGGLEALRRVAALPGSWRPQLWIARDALEAKKLKEALATYQEIINKTPKPLPSDLLVQMSGDLGNQGHLPEIITLTAPHFDIPTHGLDVGNNLIKAYLDTGQLESAGALLKQLQIQQRPDWSKHLDYWEHELTMAKQSTFEPLTKEELQVTLLTIQGPVWVKADHPIAKLFPTKPASAPSISFLGSTYEAANLPSEITAGPSDNPGRMSRALPLYLSESLFLQSNARTQTLIPWILNGAGGFVLSGTASTNDDIAQHARMSSGEENAPPSDYAVYTHLLVQGENWTAQLRVIRTIDAKLLAEFSYPFAEVAFHAVAPKVLDDLQRILAEETDVQPTSNTNILTLEGPELDHYLLRLEQSLAVRCSTMADKPTGFLSNPSEILQGTLHLCVHNPAHTPSRILLWRACLGIHKHHPDLVSSFKEKILALQTEFPLPDPLHASLSEEFATLM
jgi:tetratricopeptide (TPR) repeat protein